MVKDDVYKTFLGSYPEKEEGKENLSLVIIIGGILSADYARKEAFKQIFTNTSDANIKKIYENTILVIGNIGSDINQAIEYGKSLSAKSGITINDTKIICFSGGSQTIFNYLPSSKGIFSYIGLIDPSTSRGEDLLPLYGQQINMIHNPSNWRGEYEYLGQKLESWSRKILQAGGKTQLINISHREMPSRFFSLFYDEIIFKFEKEKPRNISAITNNTPTQTNLNNSSTRPLKLSDEYRNALTFFKDDSIGKSLDLKTTTIRGALKMMSEELLYTKNILLGVKDLAGQVYRVKEVLDEESSNFYYNNFTAKNTGLLKKRYTVGIFGLDDHLPIPETFDITEKDKVIISLYKEFDIENGLNASVGDVVIVNFNNYQMYKGGKIISNLNPSANQASQTPIGGTATSFIKDAFKGVGDKISQLLDLDTKIVDAYDTNTGKPSGKIKIKKVEGDFYLREDLAASYLAMKKAAAEQGITLVLKDAFRTHEEQEAIYNERYTNGVKNEIGKTKGPAARPGFSRHQNGIAIDVGTGGFESKIYFWLATNAPKYGFINTGKNFNKPEAWHWEYKSSGGMDT